MSAVFEDVLPSDAELEQLWRSFHSAWVGASEALAEAQERLLKRERDGSAQDVDRVLVRTLRAQERQCLAVLERFEHRLNEYRSRAAAFPRRYR